MVETSIPGAINAYQNTAGLSQGISGRSDDTVGSFADMVTDALSDSIQTVRTAEQAGIESVTGTVSVDELATSVINAEMSLRTVVAVRDRIISAYQEVIKMPI